MDDSKILSLFTQRSEEAITYAERKFGPICRNIARNLLRNDQDAEECLSDTWHTLWETIPPQHPEKLAAYTAGITRNLAMKRLTQRSAAKRSYVTVSFEELNQCIPDPTDPQTILEGRELTRLLENFLRALPLENRTLFLRRYWFFDSVRQIARQMGMTEGQVKTRLYRMRLELKEYLAKEADIYVG